MKFLYLLFFLSFSSLGFDDVLQAVVFDENSNMSSDPSNNRTLGMLHTIIERTQPKIILKLEAVSMTRSWIELQKSNNVCMYNKYKDAKREKIGTFSELPISIYPPLRFITLATNKHLFPSEISLDDDKTHMISELRIGIVDGRSYGKYIDDKIRRYPHSFFTRSGIDSSEKLIEMLAKGRIQGIIEHSDDMDTYLSRSKIAFEYTSIPIHNVTLPAYGYVVCSKTEYGQKIIDAIDDVMLTHEFQVEFVKSHKSILNKDEQYLLASEFERIFVN
jgi:uncharacterized protein (TIGR02285 family)